MAKPEYFVFVCGQQRPPGHPRGSCGEKGAANLIPALSQSLMARNLMHKVSIVPSACMGPCGVGANMLVFPGEHLYSGLATSDLDGIVESHFINGQPVAEKLAPDVVW